MSVHISRILRLLTVVAVCLITALPASAQSPVVGGELTLEEALALARRNNPLFRQQQNDAQVATWQTREAYGQLLPSSNVSSSVSYQAGGQQRFGVFSGSDLGISETPDYYFSDYSLGLSYQLSGARLFGVGQARSNEQAVEARVAAAEFNLVTGVTRQYLAALLAQDAVVLTRQELERAEENLKLAAARVSVGAAIPLDEKQAQVERGRAEVALLQAENGLVAERLRLAEQLGVELPAQTELVSEFVVSEVAVTKEALLARALERHPNLVAYRAAERASGAGVRMAQSAYLPNLFFSMGWSGYTRQSADTEYLVEDARDRIASQRTSCEQTNAVLSRLVEPLPLRDCAALTFTPAMEQSIRANNDVFPFSFTREPLAARLTVSLPLFSGFTRQRQLEQAKVAQDDARHQRRAEELRLKTEVEGAYSALVTAQRSVRLETANRELAAQQLELARERYRVGAANFLELKDAETLKARADRAYLTALYGYHEALAALEAATGQKLTSAASN